MRTHLLISAASIGLFIASLSGAEALVMRAPGGALEPTPAAMCGNTCRNGGRYIPGPPSVCAEEGLNYCGSSRGGEYSRRREYQEEEEVIAPRRYGGTRYDAPPSQASICVTQVWNCPAPRMPAGAPCACGYERGSIALTR